MSIKSKNKCFTFAISNIFVFVMTFCMASFANAQLNDYSEHQLTGEQLSILVEEKTYFPAELPAFLGNERPMQLLTLHVSAARQTINTDQFTIIASYNTLGFNHKQAYLVDAPSIQGFDFSESIKKRCAESPQTFFDNMIVDGALGFNVQW